MKCVALCLCVCVCLMLQRYAVESCVSVVNTATVSPRKRLSAGVDDIASTISGPAGNRKRMSSGVVNEDVVAMMNARGASFSARSEAGSSAAQSVVTDDSPEFIDNDWCVRVCVRAHVMTSGLLQMRCFGRVLTKQ